MKIDERIVNIIESAGIDVVLSLPCNLLSGIMAEINSREIKHVPLCREEEGIGIAAGVVLAGKRPMILMQNSGLGNCINALMSLTALYEMPLLILMSHRGGEGEQISAQKPMGAIVPSLLDTMKIGYKSISVSEDLDTLDVDIKETFEQNKIFAVLLKRELWHEAN
jgi:sulfopyruvate decarboxylase alpha subunit